MKRNILNLLIEESNGLLYEIDLNTNKLIWHKNFNEILKYPKEFQINTLESFLNILKEKDKKTFENNIKLKQNFNNEQIKIKDFQNNYSIFTNKSIYYEDAQNKYIVGILKKTKKYKELEYILDSTNDFIFYKDLNFEYLGCNEAICDLVGFKKHEIIGKSDFELFEKDIATLFNKDDKKVLKNKKTITIKEKLYSKQGKELDVLTKKSPLLDENGKIYGILGISRDITKEIRYQEKIKNNENTYKELFKANQIPVILIDINTGNILKANNSALNFYGYTSKEFSNMNINEINVMPNCKLQSKIKDAFDEKKNCFYFQHKRKDGKLLDVEVYSGPLKFNEQTILYSLIFDISKRTTAEKKLNQAHTIYQNTKEGIFITNLVGEILSVNKAFENITGYKEKEVINKRVNILKSEKQTPDFYNKMWESLKNKGSWEGEITNKTKNGKFISQWITINTIYDDKNIPINYVAVFTDITKLKENEEQLREKEQIMFHQSKMASMGEMLRNIAHQWRQPLSVISSSATGLKLKKEFGILNDNDFSEFADGILKSTNYLSDTIEDFANYFRNDKKKELFFLKNTINKTLQLCKSSFENHNVHVDLDLDYDIEIYGIENELVQVLLNIINNSIDAYKNDTKSHKKIIKISKDIEYKNLIIIIKDNAGGIEDKILDKIFEPYFTTKHSSQGTGVGLYMSQQIIQERLKGNISVSNITTKIDDIEYKGAQFKISLPLSKKILER